MRIVEPITIDDDAYSGGNLAESDSIDAPEWADATMYERGDYVRIDSVHGIYQCLADHESDNSVNDPLTEAAAFADPLKDDPDPAHWLYVEATNKWRLFDQRPSQRSTQPDSSLDTIEAEITLPSRIDTVALLELADASQVVIEVFDEDGNETFSHTGDLNDTRHIQDWFQYFYAANRLLDSYLTTSLPVTAIGDEVHITLTGGDDLACGQIVLGLAEEYGFVTPGQTGFEFQDFSHIEQDVYGDLVTVRRPATQKYRFEVELDAELVNTFARRVYDFRGGRLALFVGADTPGVRAWQYGFTRDFDIIFRSHASARADFIVQGVV